MLVVFRGAFKTLLVGNVDAQKAVSPHAISTRCCSRRRRVSRLPRELGRYNGKSERGFRLDKAHQQWAAMIFACFGGKTRGRLPLCEPSVDEFSAGERNKRTGIGALEGLEPFDPCRHGVGAERLACMTPATPLGLGEPWLSCWSSRR